MRKSHPSLGSSFELTGERSDWLRGFELVEEVSVLQVKTNTPKAANRINRKKVRAVIGWPRYPSSGHLVAIHANDWSFGRGSRNSIFLVSSVGKARVNATRLRMHSRNTLCVHVGQCGTQLGAELWSNSLRTHAECAKNAGLSPLLTCQMLEGKTKQEMHAVVVDAEPKVAARFSELYHRYRPTIVHGESGMGGCWAAGYNCDSAEASRLLDSSLEAIRRKLEALPCTLLLFTCSLSGGTGAGMTSALLQYCADEYPGIYRLVAGVLPFETGDNPLKHYNTMLSAQYMYEFGDAVMLRSNDLLAREANDLSSRQVSGHGTHSIPQMNRAFAHDITALLSPMMVGNATTFSALGHARSAPSFRWLEDVVAEVCVGKGIAGASFDVLSSSKALTANETRRRTVESAGTDQTSTACSNLGRSLWNLNQHLRTCQIGGAGTWHPMRMQLRSCYLPDDVRTASLAFKALKKLQPMVKLPIDSRIEWLQYEAPAWGPASSPALTLVTHAPWTAAALHRHVERATEMLKVRAFVHWYERAQCTELDLHSAIASVREQIELTTSRYSCP